MGFDLDGQPDGVGSERVFFSVPGRSRRKVIADEQ
jgi:hypothetical protein